MAADYFTKFGIQNIPVDDKTLFRRIENYQTQETLSLTRDVRDDKRGKTTKETTRRKGSRGSRIGGPQLRKGAIDC